MLTSGKCCKNYHCFLQIYGHQNSIFFGILIVIPADPIFRKSTFSIELSGSFIVFSYFQHDSCYLLLPTEVKQFPEHLTGCPLSAHRMCRCNPCNFTFL